MRMQDYGLWHLLEIDYTYKPIFRQWYRDKVNAYDLAKYPRFSYARFVKTYRNGICINEQFV